eukprot:TRINITY_DN20182_c0_g1_i1.p1 TRINITY_DN20182_c0_g1~~TRINITY_DN20182_c0_g1_i1.p1  ORF type:complete len:480 (+),score=94.20 TRINITY_DN20182_c0_g1_i1:284-1723(+)
MLAFSPFDSPSRSKFSTPTSARSQSTFSSPLKSSPRSAKGDRFIPNRGSMDLDLSQFHLMKENSTNQSLQTEEGSASPLPNSALDTTPAREEYKAALAESLFQGKLKTARILNFNSTESSSSSPSNSPLKLLNRSTLQEPSPVRGVKKTRHISENPERILDAPGTVDDYYLNLLDWSSQNMLAIALNRNVYIYDANTSKSSEFMRTQEQNDIITAVSFAKMGHQIAIGTNSAEIQIWDVERTKLLRTITGHSSRVSALDWNQYIVTSGSRDSTILNNDIRMPSPLVSTFEAHTQEVCGIKWSPDGSTLASGGNDNVLNIWDLHSERPKFSFEHHTAAVKALAWCPWLANLLASGGGTADRTIRFWNTANGACINSIDTKSQVCSIQWSDHYKELVSSHGFSQHQLVVWKYPTMQKMAELKGHTSRVLHLAKSPDGKTIASAAGDETLRFWKVFDYDSSIEKKQRGEIGQSPLRSLPSIR